MQQVLAGIGLLACAAMCFWAWRRWGREAAVAATLGFFALLALGESIFRRRDLEKELKQGNIVKHPAFGDEALRQQLEEALRTSQAQLDAARRDGVEGLRDELRRNREGR